MNQHAHSLEELPHQNEGGRAAHDYLGWFLRRFWILLLAVVGGLLLGIHVYSSTPPTFQSHATIEILRVKKEAADVVEEEKIRMNGIAEMLSAAEKLQIPSLFEDVARGHLFSNRENVVPEQIRYPWSPKVELSRAQISDEWLGGMMRNWVSVRWREDTNLIDIYANHTDPEVARDTLVGLLAEYERSSEEKLAGSSNYALDYILESSTTIKEKLLGAERALQLYETCKKLSEEIQDSERRIVEMEKRYLEKWPPLVEAKKHRSLLKDRFSTELDRVIHLSSEEREFWEEMEGALEEAGEEMEVDARIQLVATRSTVLEREREADQQVYDNLITKLKEGNVSKGFASRQFDVVQPPNLSTHPTGPSKKRIVAKHTAAGAFLGIGLIFLLGFLDQKIRSDADLRMISDCPVVGILPEGKKDSLVLNRSGDLRQSEAIRNMRAALTVRGREEKNRIFLVTSSISGEGKSYVAANLALAFAKRGEKTLLIDGDMRLPTLDRYFGYERDNPGLYDHLALRKPLKELVFRSKACKLLRILPAGTRSRHSAELLAGKNLPLLLVNLEKYFDRIVIDSAPLLPVSDTIPMLSHADSIVLVSRIGMTPLGAIKQALVTLLGNNSSPSGIVANGISAPRILSRYFRGYSYGEADLRNSDPASPKGGGVSLHHTCKKTDARMQHAGVNRVREDLESV